MDCQKEIRDYCWSHRVPNPVNVTLTQKQVVDGQWIDDAVSQQNFRHFRNLLNKCVFGNTSQRYGRQLSMLVTREHDNVHRHHLHAIIEQPSHKEISCFMGDIMDCWGRTRFGYSHVHFEKPASQDREDGWLFYSLKRRTKVDFASAIDWQNSTCFEPR